MTQRSRNNGQDEALTEDAAAWLQARGFNRKGDTPHSPWMTRSFGVKPTSMGWQAWPVDRDAGGCACRDWSVEAALRGAGWRAPEVDDVAPGPGAAP